MSSCGGGAAAQCTKNPLEEHDEDRRSESLDSSKQLQDAPDEPPTPRYLKPACVLIGAAIVCLALFVSNQDQTQTTNNTPAGHEQISLEMQSHVARLTDSIGDIKTNLTLIQSEVGLGYLREQRLALGYRHVTANATDLQANVDQLADSVGDIKSNLTLAQTELERGRHREQQLALAVADLRGAVDQLQFDLSVASCDGIGFLLDASGRSCLATAELDTIVHFPCGGTSAERLVFLQASVDHESQVDETWSRYQPCGDTLGEAQDGPVVLDIMLTHDYAPRETFVLSADSVQSHALVSIEVTIEGAPGLPTQPRWNLRPNRVAQVVGPAESQCFTSSGLPGYEYCSCGAFDSIFDLSDDEINDFLFGASSGECIAWSGGLIKNKGGILRIERVDLLTGVANVAGAIEVTEDPLAYWLIGSGITLSSSFAQLDEQTARSAQAVISRTGVGFGIPDVVIRDSSFEGNYASLHTGGAISFQIAGSQVSGPADVTVGVSLPSMSDMMSVVRCTFNDNHAYTSGAPNAALRVGNQPVAGMFVNCTCDQVACDCNSGAC